MFIPAPRPHAAGNPNYVMFAVLRPIRRQKKGAADFVSPAAPSFSLYLISKSEETPGGETHVPEFGTLRRRASHVSSAPPSSSSYIPRYRSLGFVSTFSNRLATRVNVWLFSSVLFIAENLFGFKSAHLYTRYAHFCLGQEKLTQSVDA